MKIHEFQAKAIFRDYGIPVPRGVVIENAGQAEDAFRELGAGLVAVKAQVHAGGRGKGGGVKLARTPEEASSIAAAIFSRPLVTHQTGSKGVTVHRILIEEGMPFERQFYVGIVLDRAAEKPVMMVSAEGGVEIEQVARERPDAIAMEHFDPQRGLDETTAMRLSAGLGLKGDQAGQAAQIMRTLARIFLEKDCSLIEINPLVLTQKGQVAAIDAKCNFDDNALYRHEELQAMRDRSEEDPREAEAADYDFSYVSLDGNIGCMVNGAGLAMATNDIITHAGGKPANFLDVGGAADPQRVTNAFKLVLGDERVETVLVNIFGGIVKCDVIANGIAEALKIVPLRVPMVVRLEGTNVEIGRQILRDSGHPLIEATDFQDAAVKAVAAARGKGSGCCGPDRGPSASSNRGTGGGSCCGSKGGAA